ncbi:hypothetical protein [Lysobacter gummosus]
MLEVQLQCHDARFDPMCDQEEEPSREQCGGALAESDRHCAN